MYDNLIDALRRNATAEALVAANALVASQPDDPQAHRLLAAALRQQHDLAGALAAIDRAIELAPEQASLHLERAGLLIGAHRPEDARGALTQVSALDPNQFDAYILQAQLALGRGDLEAADNQSRLASRIAPEHPQVAAIDGMLALRRGDTVRAMSILSQGAQAHPDDLQLLYALGSAYLQQGHLAFAEQAFRGVLEKSPDAAGLRGLIAGLMGRQGNPKEAVVELAPLLANPATDTPALRLIAGELELQAGRPDEALPHLKQALAARPHDRRTLASLMQAWRQLDAAPDARTTLEAALATTPDSHDLWLARLSLEQPGGGDALQLVERWVAAMPQHVPALEARMSLHEDAGEQSAAEVLAYNIVELEPGRSSGEMVIVESLLARDPQAAIARIQGLIDNTTDAESRNALRSWLGLVQDRARRFDAALDTWTTLAVELAPQRLPLPPTSAPREQWPALAGFHESAPMVVFLWGLPGSGIERIGAVFGAGWGPFCTDRFGATPPNDPLQRYDTVPKLAAGTLDGAELVAEWRAQVAVRGFLDGNIIDWLLWWDNSLLLGLRPYLPEAMLVVALRDPRDMLLDWLAYGAPAPFAINSVKQAAAWLVIALNQLATLHEQNLFPHRLIKLDGIAENPQAVAAAIDQALETTMPVPESFGSRHFPAGHWREYAQVLSEPFALLTPVAKRLGYPET